MTRTRNEKDGVIELNGMGFKGKDCYKGVLSWKKQSEHQFHL